MRRPVVLLRHRPPGAARAPIRGFGQHGLAVLRHPAEVPRFEAAQDAYRASWNLYFTKMGHRSVHHTDGVGPTLPAAAEIQAVCTHTHAPVPSP